MQKSSESLVNTDLKVSATTNFPSWLQGQWQFLNVIKNQLIFRDHSSFKSYRMTLVNQLSEEKFIVLSRSQCGEESFKCLWIRKLDENILEFQSSSESVKKITSYAFCNDDEFFDNRRWLTQASMIPQAMRVNFSSLNDFSRFLLGIGKDVQKSSCPINGKYFGRLPDDLELCSLMTSSCNSDVMHFQIGPCDSNDVYEKRIYQCLGQWTDSRSSTVYTFTKRIDNVVNTYECFVGLMAGSEKHIVIREAGENCFKMLDPHNYGMEMNQTGESIDELCLQDQLNESLNRIVLEPCRDGNHLDEEIIVRPTQDDHSITYETVFDDGNNNIDFNTATSSTRKPKS